MSYLLKLMFSLNWRILFGSPPFGDQRTTGMGEGKMVGFREDVGHQESTAHCIN